MPDHVRLINARPGTRLRDRDGQEWVRTRTGVAYDDSAAPKNDGVESGYDVDPIAVLRDDYAHCEEMFGPFTLASPPEPAPAWEAQRTYGRARAVDAHPDEAQPPQGLGWEPFASGILVANGGAVCWRDWRRRTPASVAGKAGVGFCPVDARPCDCGLPIGSACPPGHRRRP